MATQDTSGATSSTSENAAPQQSNQLGRREFISSAAALGAMPLLSSTALSRPAGADPIAESSQPAGATSLIGNYGGWAAGLVEDPPQLSFRLPGWTDIERWRPAARSKTAELLAAPASIDTPQITVVERTQFDGLDIEHLTWQLPYGRPTQAVLLKPQSVKGPLPGVLGLHDHGGNKYFGHRKITRTSAEPHPMMAAHQQGYYGDRAWANELAKRGYVVLVHDAFAFASRRVMLADMQEIRWGDSKTVGRSDDNPELSENIKAYNAWAGQHEDIMAKSLFCAGTTWPGVFLSEDQAALSVLLARDDVDGSRVGCAGLSGGGLRTVFLGGLDERIKCAICVGFMSTWQDFLLHKSFTHTWMTFAPLLPKFLDFPEILGMRAPLATMVQNCYQDGLYTVAEMQLADEILQSVFAKCGQPERYSGRFYEGEHKFDVAMQSDAFEWFDRWLT